MTEAQPKAVDQKPVDSSIGLSRQRRFLIRWPSAHGFAETIQSHFFFRALGLIGTRATLPPHEVRPAKVPFTG